MGIIFHYSSPYRPPTLHVNMGPQPYTFSNPFGHAHVEPFPPSIILALPIAHNQTP